MDRWWYPCPRMDHTSNCDLHNEQQPKYIRNKTWYFMPMVNPDGYVYSRHVNRLWRKNRSPNKGSKCKGVDINRNFKIGWNTVGSSSNPCSDIYHGTSVASEKETQAIVRFLKRRKSKLKGFITFHSFHQAIAYPYAYKAIYNKYTRALQRVGERVAKRIRAATDRIYKVGARHKILRKTGGSADDWSFGSLGVKYAYTIELRDRGRYGFLLPPKQIRGTAYEGYLMVDTVARNI